MCCILYTIIKWLLSAIVVSVLTGVVAALVWERLKKYYEDEDFRKYLSHLRSPDKDTFDWVCYSMRNDDGRLVESTPDGSVVNVQHIGGNRLMIRLKQQSDGRIWEGELKMETHNVGRLFAKYVNEHEYRFMDVYIGMEEVEGVKHDFIFTIPTKDNLYYMELKPDNKITPYYNYGKEIFRRKKT